MRETPETGNGIVSKGATSARLSKVAGDTTFPGFDAKISMVGKWGAYLALKFPLPAMRVAPEALLSAPVP
jgi:hypothetical protein